MLRISPVYVCCVRRTLRSHEINSWTMRNGALADLDEAGSQDDAILDSKDNFADLQGGFDTVIPAPMHRDALHADILDMCSGGYLS